MINLDGFSYGFFSEGVEKKLRKDRDFRKNKLELKMHDFFRLTGFEEEVFLLKKEQAKLTLSKSLRSIEEVFYKTPFGENYKRFLKKINNFRFGVEVDSQTGFFNFISPFNAEKKISNTEKK